MSKTESLSRTGEGVSPVAEMKSAVSGFVSELKIFQEDIQTEMSKQKERVTMLERKTVHAARPHLAAATVFDAPHKKAFDAYLRSGEDDGLRGLELEGKAIETGTPTIERISIPLHELSALPKASQRLLDDSAFDIEAWLAGRIADKFARAEAAAFINGDGVDKPMGIMTHPSVDDASWSWGNLGYVATGMDGDFDGGDAIIDLVYALGAQYRANASFVMNSKSAGAVRKLKDADGRFLWSDGLAAGEPARLLGYPVLIAEDMPDIASGADAIAFGDFAAGYTVAERPDLRVLRDPFSAKPHVMFYATKRIGGDVSDFAAIKLLRFALS
ncbi:Phage capsid family protein [Shimia sp. SK013]|uniref:phage major capsid protein n=1 Tax=Shimia sp. SK013 TaxID=1389006 RepID=UPI0006B5A5CC|nr:phage major capsid protein [Shimia sp. SK013]KPA22818.1 Phage capsid family protein [Shimia sp. SK013]